jgi:hypothetical protein
MGREFESRMGRYICRVVAFFKKKKQEKSFLTKQFIFFATAMQITTRGFEPLHIVSINIAL